MHTPDYKNFLIVRLRDIMCIIGRMGLYFGLYSKDLTMGSVWFLL